MVYDERLLMARIDLGQVAGPRQPDYQERYCRYIDDIARHYRVSSDDLAGAYMSHYGPTIILKEEGRPDADDL